MILSQDQTLHQNIFFTPPTVVRPWVGVVLVHQATSTQSLKCRSPSHVSRSVHPVRRLNAHLALLRLPHTIQCAHLLMSRVCPKTHTSPSSQGAKDAGRVNPVCYSFIAERRRCRIFVAADFCHQRMCNVTHCSPNRQELVKHFPDWHRPLREPLCRCFSTPTDMDCTMSISGVSTTCCQALPLWKSWPRFCGPR